MTYDPTRRTDYGYPAAVADPAHLPREQAQLQDQPLLIEMYEQTSFLGSLIDCVIKWLERMCRR